MEEYGNKLGFTLSELLIVVAIIGVLVGVSIPVFTSQLEKSREAKDLANVRVAYSEVKLAAINDDKSSGLYDDFKKMYIKTVYLTQNKNGWSINADKLSIGEVTVGDDNHWKGEPLANGRCDVMLNPNDSMVTLLWDGMAIYNGYQWKIVGDKLVRSDTSYDANNWPASSIPDFIEIKNDGNSKIVLDVIDDKYPNLSEYLKTGGYEIGYFVCDKDGKILFDSGGISFKDKMSITIEERGNQENAYVAIQFFKMKEKDNHNAGSYKLTDDEIKELERLIKVVSN